MEYPEPIQNLIEEFKKLPGVGPRTAARYAFFLLKKSGSESEQLTEAISKLHQNIKTCSFCFNPFDLKDSSKSSKKDLCKICGDPSRDRTKICIVEKEADLHSVEETNQYQGLYFILGGTIPTLKKKGTDKKIRVNKLVERIKNPEKFGVLDAEINEIIIATNPTTEGEATALYLERKLKPLNKKITRLGRGMPVGGELEYADQETLSSALESRR